MKRNTKLYGIWDGRLEVVTFLEEGIAPGATTPTYLCLAANGQRFRCSRDMFLSSELEALRLYLTQCREGLEYRIEALNRVSMEIADLEDEIEFTKTRIADLTTDETVV